MGTPEFATASLKALVDNDFEVVAVVTMPDKPAGRGQKLSESDVKKFAVEKNLPVLQPTNLKDAAFLAELQALKADLQVVVAFRMLPEVVWSMPTFGTLNLHGSLLPHYRGAAPINRALMNGETLTGLTTFFIEKEIDTGKIILREEVTIHDTDTAGILHDRMMEVGAQLLVKTIQAIENQDYPQIPQSEFITEGEVLKSAPKIFKEDCRINWNRTTWQTYNFVRGLSPYPAAWTEIERLKDNKLLNIKIFECQPLQQTHTLTSGTIVSDNKSELKIALSDGFLIIKELQMEGKKRLSTAEFLRGIDWQMFDNQCK